MVLNTFETRLIKTTTINNNVRVSFIARFNGTDKTYERNFKYIPEQFSRKEVLEAVKAHIPPHILSNGLKSCDVWTFVQGTESYHEDGEIISERDIETFLFDGILSDKKCSEKTLDIVKLAKQHTTAAPSGCN